MATTTGPLMSMEASGTIGKTLTFARWKGRAYVRTRVIPHNPRSASQYATRAMMRFLTQQWTAVPIVDTTWRALAEATKISPFNAFVQFNMRAWTQFLMPGQTNPPSRSSTAIAPGSLTAVGGVGQISGVSTNLLNLDTWGTIISLSITPAFTPGRNDTRLILPSPVVGDTPYTLIAVPPGTYYVTAGNFDTDGASPAFHADVGPITVT